MVTKLPPKLLNTSYILTQYRNLLILLNGGGILKWEVN